MDEGENDTDELAIVTDSTKEVGNEDMGRGLGLDKSKSPPRKLLQQACYKTGTKALRASGRIGKGGRRREG